MEEVPDFPVPALISRGLSSSWGAVHCCHHSVAPDCVLLIIKKKHSSFPKAWLRPYWYVIQTLVQVYSGQ